MSFWHDQHYSHWIVRLDDPKAEDPKVHQLDHDDYGLLTMEGEGEALSSFLRTLGAD